jgi:hypothetical protein
MLLAHRVAHCAASVSLLTMIVVLSACGAGGPEGGNSGGGGGGTPPPDPTTPQNPISSFINVAVSTAADIQRAPKVLADGGGGSFVVWEDFRSGTSRIYAQHIDNTGAARWADGGVAISSSAATQTRPRIASDNGGGFIVVWEDGRNALVTQTDLYAQRLDANGVSQWPSDAIISSAGGDQTHAEIAEDNGDIFVVWQDTRMGLAGVSDIYAQRLLANGSMGWTQDGVAVSVAANIQQLPKITRDGNGGAILAWERFVDPEAGLHHIYLQRLDGNGIPQWDVNGSFYITWHNANRETATQGTLYRDSFTRLLEDGAGGAFVLFRDRRTAGDSNISMQRVNADGTLQWQSPAAPVSWQRNSNQLNPRMAPDGNGGVIVVWEDYRSALHASDIYAQRLDADGTRLWQNGTSLNGVPVTSVTLHQGEPRIVSDGSGGAIVAWEANANEAGMQRKNVYAQRLNDAGAVQWESNGVPIVTAPRDQIAIDIAADGNGGAFLAWQDGRTDTFDIYAQHIDTNGQ